MDTILAAILTARIETNAGLPAAVKMLNAGELDLPAEGLALAGEDGTRVVISALSVGVDHSLQGVLDVFRIDGTELDAPIDVIGMSNPTVCARVVAGGDSKDCSLVYDNTDGGSCCPACTARVGTLSGQAGDAPGSRGYSEALIERYVFVHDITSEEESEALRQACGLLPGDWGQWKGNDRIGVHDAYTDRAIRWARENGKPYEVSATHRHTPSGST